MRSKTSSIYFIMFGYLKLRCKLTRGIVVTGVLSKCSHSIFGGGLPFATQSIWLSTIFVNSKWCGGSIVNEGPCISNGSAITQQSIGTKKRNKSIQIRNESKSIDRYLFVFRNLLEWTMKRVKSKNKQTKALMRFSNYTKFHLQIRPRMSKHRCMHECIYRCLNQVKIIDTICIHLHLKMHL